MDSYRYSLLCFTKPKQKCPGCVLRVLENTGGSHMRTNWNILCGFNLISNNSYWLFCFTCLIASANTVITPSVKPQKLQPFFSLIPVQRKLHLLLTPKYHVSISHCGSWIATFWLLKLLSTPRKAQVCLLYLLLCRRCRFPRTFSTFTAGESVTRWHEDKRLLHCAHSGQ